MADCLNNEEQVTSNLDSKNQDSLNSNLDTGNAITSDIVSDGVLVSNTNSGESVSSVLESGEALASQLDLPVTHTYRGAETDNIVVSVDNNSYTISASLKQIKFKTVADFPVVGSDKLLYIDATENSLYSWDSDLGQYRKLTADVGDVENYDDTELRNMIAELNNKKADKTEIPDVSQFITKTVSDLENYYRKSETYTQAEIDAKISAIPKFSIQVVASLPTENISETTVYLVASGSESQNLYTEYIYVNGVWEKLGEQKLDLSGYPTIEQMNTAIANALAVYYTKTETDTLLDKKVDKVEGKGLSTNDLTDDLLGKINNNTVIEITESSVHIKDLGSGIYKLPMGCTFSFYATNKFTAPSESYLFVTETNEGRREFYILCSDYYAQTGIGNKYLISGYAYIPSAVGYSYKFVINKDYVDTSTDQSEIYGTKTFKRPVKMTEELSQNVIDDDTLVTAKWTKDKLDTKQDKLDAGTGITIEGNRISASLGDGAQIIKLSSPVHIYNLDSGVYQLPAGCELYYNNSYASGEEHYYRINYVNEAETILFVQTTEYYATQKSDRKLFVLFAENDSYGKRGAEGSFIVGVATATGGSNHIAGIDTSIYIPREGDALVYGTKTFQSPTKYSSTVSLATTLNDKTLVDAQWVKAQGYVGSSILNEYVHRGGDVIYGALQVNYANEEDGDEMPLILVGKGNACYIYLGSENGKSGLIGVDANGKPIFKESYNSTDKELALKSDIPDTSDFVTETELTGKGYLTSVPSEYVTETELTNKGYATTSALNNKLNTSDLLGKVYPVGSIYMSVSATSPASFLGGTWTQLKDRFLIGAGGSYSNGATGGATTVTLTTSQIPSHTHAVHDQLVGYYSSGTWLGIGGGSGFKTGLNTAYSVGATGGGQSHNNMPPYLAVYMWKRTA